MPHSIFMFAAMRNRRTFIALTVFTLAAGTAATAQPAPQKIGDFRDWSAWIYRDGDQKVCFITSAPQQTLPTNVSRGDIRFNVAHRPADGVQGEVSMIVGYPFAENREAVAQVGSTEVGLTTDGERAWTVDPADDRTLVNAMKAGLQMIVKGQSSRGTETTDTYSLLGFTAAYSAIDTACE